MKLKFLATGQAPESYEINGEAITAHEDDKTEVIDLSALEEGGKFHGIELDTLELTPSQVIRHAERINGELHVTLCQQSGNSGIWQQSDVVDATEYDPTKTYIKRIDANGNTEA